MIWIPLLRIRFRRPVLWALSMAAAMGIGQSPGLVPAGRAQQPDSTQALAPPQFTMLGGVYTNASMIVELASEEADAVIRYTLNGSNPTTNSMVYTQPLSIAYSVLIRAKAFSALRPPSATVTQSYTLLGNDLLTFNSNLPLVIINTYGHGISENTWVMATTRFIDTVGGYSTLMGNADYDGCAGVGLRGSSSLQFPKTPYKMELWDESGNAKKTSLLGLPAESDWVLYAPYSDKTLIRNVLSYELFGKMEHYSVRTRLIELFVDVYGGRLTMSDYKGVYVLVEKIKRGDHRVDIEKLLPTDNVEPNVTGGYLLKKDRLDPGDLGFSTSHAGVLAYVDPKEKEMTASQKSWLKGWFSQFEAALYGANYRDRTNGYAKYIDVNSFIDLQWMVESTKNIDGYRLSHFMYKDRLGKLSLGPIWDWDLSLGNANYLDGWKTNGWYWSLAVDTDYPWFRRLFQDPDFNQQSIDRWGELRQDVLNTTQVLSRIDELTGQLQSPQTRNYQRWPVLGQSIWPNWYVGRTYPDEVNWLKQWITGRLAWIDSNYLPAPVLDRDGGPIAPGFSLSMRASTGTIYYTRDGRDPRLPGGVLDPKAQVYVSPLWLTTNSRIFARIRQTNAWSPPAIATFTVDIPPLIVTEIMYHPAPPPAGSTNSADDFEFVELKNIGAATLDLNGVHFGAGIGFDFSGSAITRLAAGENVLLVKNVPAFEERYGTGLKVAGQFTGKLDNRGDRVAVFGQLEEPILDFSYSDAWHPSTDGQGYSLVVVDEYAPRTNWANQTHWRPSSDLGGSPGSDEPPESYDTWKTRFFSPLQLADPNISGDLADADHDGCLNRAEYLSGTNPWDPSSSLRLELVEWTEAGGLRLRFHAVAGRAYAVQFCDRLTGGNWKQLTGVTPRPTNQYLEISDPQAGSELRGYYRLVIPSR